MPLPEFSADTAKLRSDKACSDREIQEFTRAYYGAISEVDHWIGSIVQTLKEEGLWDNTVVVFTSDHGEWCGEHLRYGKGYWAPDCVSRVPLIVRVPEGRGGAAGRKVDDIVECVDIVPTLLDTAAVPIEPHVQGDLLPVTRARTACAGDGLGLCEGTGTGSPIPGSWKALRGPGYHYVVNADGSERLYDMEKDPHGLRDVAKAPQYSNRLQEARLSLLGRMLRIEQPLKREWPY
jgi:arylsulfatase A-like enzyme